MQVTVPSFLCVTRSSPIPSTLSYNLPSPRSLSSIHNITSPSRCTRGAVKSITPQSSPVQTGLCIQIVCAFVSSSGSVNSQVLHVNGLVLPRPPEPGPSAAAAAAAALAPRGPPLAVAFEKRRAHYANVHITYCLGDAVETFGLTGKEVQGLPRKQV